MIAFNFDISTPFYVEFKNFWCRAWATPFKNKFIELELYTVESLIGFNFLWTTRRDHAGVDIQLSLFSLCLHFNFYDSRHWDLEKNQWCVYDDVKE